MSNTILIKNNLDNKYNNFTLLFTILKERIPKFCQEIDFTESFLKDIKFLNLSGAIKAFTNLVQYSNNNSNLNNNLNKLISTLNKLKNIKRMQNGCSDEVKTILDNSLQLFNSLEKSKFLDNLKILEESKYGLVNKLNYSENLNESKSLNKGSPEPKKTPLSVQEPKSKPITHMP